MRAIVGWFVLALVMLVLVIVLQPSFATYGLCFLAWCGGVMSTVAAQTYRRRTW